MKASKICNHLATILIIIVVLIAVPLVVPRIFGYQVYGVLSGSMEPNYPIGSIIYVENIDTSKIKVDDVITFKMSAKSNVVATHRVIEINQDEQSFTTKGDANKEKDSATVSKQRVLGRAIFCIPLFGYISMFTQSSIGIITSIGVIALIFILWFLADRFKKKESERK